MINLNDKVVNINNSGMTQYSSQPNFSINKNCMATDSVSFSRATSDKDKSNDKKKQAAYIAGAIVLVTGLIILLANLKKGKIPTGSVSKDAKDGAKEAESSLEKEAQLVKEKLAQQAKEEAELKKQLADLDRKPSSIPDSKIKTSDVKPKTPAPTMSAPKPAEPVIFKPQLSKVVDDEVLDQGYEVSAKEYAKADQLLNGKEEFIKKTLPDLYKALGKPDNNTLIAVLKVITPENRDFMIKEAIPNLYKAFDQATLLEALKVITPENKDFLIKESIPVFERNAEELEIKKSMPDVLKLLTPQNIDCLDKLASKAKEYKIENASDTLALLRTLTPEKKELAFNELFPYLLENSEKLKITTGIDMAKFLRITTPENKDFIIKEAIPTVMQNAQKLKIGLVGVIKILGIVDKNNLKTIETIANNIEKYDIRDQDGFFDIEKFEKCLNQN